MKSRLGSPASRMTALLAAASFTAAACSGGLVSDVGASPGEPTGAAQVSVYEEPASVEPYCGVIERQDRLEADFGATASEDQLVGMWQRRMSIQLQAEIVAPTKIRSAHGELHGMLGDAVAALSAVGYDEERVDPDAPGWSDYVERGPQLREEIAGFARSTCS